jgi:hypothetical protein
MPCTTQPNRTPEVIKRQQSAIDRLNAALGDNTAQAVVGANGAIAFKGWKENEGVSDLCAYRALAASNSANLRRAIMRAEALAGRLMDARAVAAGTHSHDGGSTWHAGH